MLTIIVGVASLVSEFLVVIIEIFKTTLTTNIDREDEVSEGGRYPGTIFGKIKMYVRTGLIRDHV